MQSVQYSKQILLTIAWLALDACGVEPPPRRAAGPLSATPAISAAAVEVGGCLPVLSGELVINEVLARPNGLDIDGDGLSNLRDEAIEVRLVASQPRQLDGLALSVSAQPRGQLSDPRCHPPGTLFVLLGATAATPVLPGGAVGLRLSGPLALRDDGAQLTLTGRAGNALDQLSYPAAPAGRSQVRKLDSDPWAPLQPHPNTPLGEPHSLGRCSDGTSAASCWPSILPG